MFQSEKSLLFILGIVAILCSRALFWFFNDPEGPNLLIVMVTAVVVYAASLVVYVSSLATIGLKKFLLAISIQILLLTGFYLFLS